jgi:S1-C subfamily serine protease
MGDVIVKFNGKPVTNFYDLPAMLMEDVIGKEMKIEILREEKLATLTIMPKEAEEENDD